MTCLSDNITGIVTYAINTDKRFRDFSYEIIDKSVDLSKNWQTKGKKLFTNALTYKISKYQTV